jgi:hypothetical protein
MTIAAIHGSHANHAGSYFECNISVEEAETAVESTPPGGRIGNSFVRTSLLEPNAPATKLTVCEMSGIKRCVSRKPGVGGQCGRFDCKRANP